MKCNSTTRFRDNSYVFHADRRQRRLINVEKRLQSEEFLLINALARKSLGVKISLCAHRVAETKEEK